MRKPQGIIQNPGYDNSYLIDKHVGGRLRLRRNQVGMSQGRLGKVLGISFQQIQKYENGTNRIAFSRLLQIASILEVSLNWFVEGLPATVLAHAPSDQKQSRSLPALFIDPEIFRQRETIELLRIYYDISESKVRQNIFNLIKDIAKVK